MQDKIIIYLDNVESTHFNWVTVKTDATIDETVTSGDETELAEACHNKLVIVLIPAQDVLLTQVKLPKLPRSRLYQAIPYALEEQLIVDIESLHFAVGEFKANEDLDVAVVAREKMDAWVAKLQSLQVIPDCLIPVSLALPLQEGAWHVFVDDLIYLRTDVGHGFASDRRNAEELINLAFETAMPEQIYISNYTNKSLQLSGVATEECLLPNERLLPDLATNVIKYPYINLLQHHYASKKSRYPGTKKLWQYACYLAAGLVFLLFLYPTVSYFILNSRLSAINAQIATIYHRNFPQSKNMVAPKIRMQEKLKKMTAQSAESHFYTILKSVGKAMTESSGITLNRFDYQNNQLTLQLTAASSEDFATFTDSLQQQGQNVKQQNATLTDTKINATLIIG